MEKYQVIWGLETSYWKRSHAWTWPKAAADAFTLLTAQSVQLICREVRRGSRTYVEIKRPKEITVMGLLSPLPESYPLDKIRFARLVEFFTKDSIEARVCHYILQQMLEAARQKSRQACELLLSNVLEAALQTLEGKPYLPRKKKGRRLDIKQSLRKFYQTYLNNQWIPWFDKAHAVWKRMRHRNAHPYWLYFQEDSLSDERKSEFLEDIIFLSRLYAYMMLALSGEKTLQLDFPKKPFR